MPGVAPAPQSFQSRQPGRELRARYVTSAPNLGIPAWLRCEPVAGSGKGGSQPRPPVGTGSCSRCEDEVWRLGGRGGLMTPEAP